MPTYEYQCDACGHGFELFQSMTAPVKRKCPKCGKAKLQRLIGTGAGIIFKGGGFYQTDYRSEGYAKAAEADKKAAEPAAKESPAAESTAKKETKAEASAPAESSRKSPLRAPAKPSRRRTRRRK